MFKKMEVNENEKLNAAINAVLTALSNHTPGTKEYAATADQLTKLYRVKETDLNLQTKIIDTLNKQEDSATNRESNCKLKEIEIMAKEEEFRTRNRPKPETLALIGGNLAGILLILGYEHANVITSKAFGLLTKLK